MVVGIIPKRVINIKDELITKVKIVMAVKKLKFDEAVNYVLAEYFKDKEGINNAVKETS